MSLDDIIGRHSDRKWWGNETSDQDAGRAFPAIGANSGALERHLADAEAQAEDVDFMEHQRRIYEKYASMGQPTGLGRSIADCARRGFAQGGIVKSRKQYRSVYDHGSRLHEAIMNSGRGIIVHDEVHCTLDEDTAQKLVEQFKDTFPAVPIQEPDATIKVSCILDEFDYGTLEAIFAPQTEDKDA